jgi:hypothetical protein
LKQKSGAPSNKAVVILNTSEKDKMNNLAIMTNVSIAYAPAGKVLVSVSCAS